MSVGIIGGGAAGLFAGCFLKREGVDPVILEKGERPGRKLLLTGHGRCNITNRKPPVELKKGYREAGNFIYRAIKSFTPDDAVKFITEELKVPLKEEDNNRMFPESDSAVTIVDALTDYIGKENIVTGFDCAEILRGNDGFTVVSRDGRERFFDTLILATGGKSYPATGSDGSGYKLAEGLGHTITPLYPALCSVDVSDKDREFTSSVSGVSVSAGASLYCNSKKKAGTTGDVLFTHRGVSGPAIMEISREIPRDVVSEDGWIEIDFTPGRTDEELDRELLEEMKKRSNAKLTTIGADHVPASVAEALGVRAGVTELYSKDCDKASRKVYLRELKHLELKIERPPVYETSYVTRGGVSLSEIDRDSMASQKVSGLYMIGEINDVDGMSGGYNLQACMSEAFIAVRDIIG
ncbi:MAG: aminoacetone oxidase family FAD-binding enzyme [Clostridiales bacterium]|nr:aminoacetone oxidase family FAD-binding enzyme [Clostridiales bacterium]